MGNPNLATAYSADPINASSSPEPLLRRPAGISDRAPLPTRCANYDSLHSPNEARLLKLWRAQSKAIDRRKPHRRLVQLSRPAAAAELELSERTIGNLIRSLERKQTIQVMQLESGKRAGGHQPLKIVLREYAEVLTARRQSAELGRDYEETPWAMGWWRRPLTQAEIDTPWDINAQLRAFRAREAGARPVAQRASTAVSKARFTEAADAIRAWIPDLDNAAIRTMLERGLAHLEKLSLPCPVGAIAGAVRNIPPRARRGELSYPYFLHAFPDQLERAVRRFQLEEREAARRQDHERADQAEHQARLERQEVHDWTVYNDPATEPAEKRFLEQLYPHFINKSPP